MDPRVKCKIVYWVFAERDFVCRTFLPPFFFTAIMTFCYVGEKAVVFKKISFLKSERFFLLSSRKLSSVVIRGRSDLDRL